jgi:hypothetical protein
MSGAVVASQFLDIGIAHFKRNQFREALAHFDASIKLAPSDPYARWNRATALLSLGEYERGFIEHDEAWENFKVIGGFSPVADEDIDRLKAMPIWRGESGARVLFYHDMGLGDAIMAFRYLRELVRRTSKLTLVIDWPLARLARQFGVEVVSGVPADLSQYDSRLPFFSVMSALQQTAETIPNEPYIFRHHWCRSGDKIGVAWSGRTQTAFSAERFLPMINHDGFKLYALQTGQTIDGVEPLKPGCDFADLADRIAEMDHIISVDTAAIHLAGAMGHPSAHLVLPFLSDWRWWHTARWYPSLHTYRQPTPDDWSTPFARLNEAAFNPRGVADGRCRHSQEGRYDSDADAGPVG